jgi:hypothetical protein
MTTRIIIAVALLIGFVALIVIGIRHEKPGRIQVSPTIDSRFNLKRPITGGTNYGAEHRQGSRGNWSGGELVSLQQTWGSRSTISASAFDPNLAAYSPSALSLLQMQDTLTMPRKLARTRWRTSFSEARA